MVRSYRKDTKFAFPADYFKLLVCISSKLLRVYLPTWQLAISYQQTTRFASLALVLYNARGGGVCYLDISDYSSRGAASVMWQHVRAEKSTCKPCSPLPPPPTTRQDIFSRRPTTWPSWLVYFCTCNRSVSVAFYCTLHLWSNPLNKVNSLARMSNYQGYLFGHTF